MQLSRLEQSSIASVIADNFHSKWLQYFKLGSYSRCKYLYDQLLPLLQMSDENCKQVYFIMKPVLLNNFLPWFAWVRIEIVLYNASPLSALFFFLTTWDHPESLQYCFHCWIIKYFHSHPIFHIKSYISFQNKSDHTPPNSWRKYSHSSVTISKY